MTIDDESENGKITHADKLGKLVVDECAMESLYETGDTGYAIVRKGHVVIDGGNVELVYKDTTNASDVMVETKNGGTVEHAHAKSSSAAVNNDESGNALNVTFDYDGRPEQDGETTTMDHSTTSEEHPYDVEGEGDEIVLNDQSSEESPAVENISNGVVFNFSTKKYYSLDASGTAANVIYSGSRAKALTDAIDQADDGETLYLLQNVSGLNSTISIDNSIIIEGQSHKISASILKTDLAIHNDGARYNGIFNIAGANINFYVKNVDLENNQKSTALNFVNTSEGAKVSLKNVSISAQQYGICTDETGKNQTLILNNVEFAPGFNCLYWRSSNGTITANDCNFTSSNSYGGSSNSFSAIALGEPQTTAAGYAFDELVANNTITLNNCTVISSQTSSSVQSCINIRSPYNNKLFLNNCGLYGSPALQLGCKYVTGAVYSNGKYTSAGTDLTDTYGEYEQSHIYIDGVLADNNVNVYKLVCMVGHGSLSVPTCGGTYTDKSKITAISDDYVPFYGYKVLDNGNGTWSVVEDK